MSETFLIWHVCMHINRHIKNYYGIVMSSKEIGISSVIQPYIECSKQVYINEVITS